MRALDPATAAPLVAGAGPAGRPSSRSADTASQRSHGQGACSFLRHPGLRSPADPRHASSRSVFSCPPRPGPHLAPHDRPAHSLRSRPSRLDRDGVDFRRTACGRGAAGSGGAQRSSREGEGSTSAVFPTPTPTPVQHRHLLLGSPRPSPALIMSLAQQRHHRPPRARSLVPLSCWTTSTNRSSLQAPPTWPQPPPSQPSHQLQLLRRPAAAASLSFAYLLRSSSTRPLDTPLAPHPSPFADGRLARRPLRRRGVQQAGSTAPSPRPLAVQATTSAARLARPGPSGHRRAPALLLVQRGSRSSAHPARGTRYTTSTAPRPASPASAPSSTSRSSPGVLVRCTGWLRTLVRGRAVRVHGWTVKGDAAQLRRRWASRTSRTRRGTSAPAAPGDRARESAARGRGRRALRVGLSRTSPANEALRLECERANGESRGRGSGAR